MSRLDARLRKLESRTGPGAGMVVIRGSTDELRAQHAAAIERGELIEGDMLVEIQTFGAGPLSPFQPYRLGADGRHRPVLTIIDTGVPRAPGPGMLTADEAEAMNASCRS